MEGPTPVSALLHAATMVTAGIYLFIRIFEIYKNNIENEIINKYFFIYLSFLTILLNGIIGFFQFDIKKIIAFSTSAQLGFMFLIVSFLNEKLGFFHLLSHAYFKALLFLLAGVLIHLIFDNQDIRKFGNIIFKLPLTFLFFLVGSLSITSFPFFSGFYSKDSIIDSLFFYKDFYFFAILTHPQQNWV